MTAEKQALIDRYRSLSDDPNIEEVIADYIAGDCIIGVLEPLTPGLDPVPFCSKVRRVGGFKLRPA